MGTESRSPHQQSASLNQTIFSQAGEGNLAAARGGREEGDPSRDAGSARPQGKRGFCSAAICSAKAEAEVTSSSRAEKELSQRAGLEMVYFLLAPVQTNPQANIFFCINKTVCLAS